MALMGTTQKALKVLARKENAEVSRILRNLRKKTNKNFKWKLEEGKGGSIKLYSVNFTAAAPKTKKSKSTSKASSKKTKATKSKGTKKKKSSKKK